MGLERTIQPVVRGQLLFEGALPRAEQDQGDQGVVAFLLGLVVHVGKGFEGFGPQAVGSKITASVGASR